MLKKLTLLNFQSHRYTEVDFSRGVNVITGSSNVGKTAILRALGWVLTNRPLGDSFIHKGENTVSVRLEFIHNLTCFQVERTKHGSDNQYRLMEGFHDSSDGQEKSVLFSSFGRDVPEEVSSVLNMSDVNIQGQLTPYFLILDTPGEVALHVNKTTKLDEVDAIISNIRGKLRDTKRILEREKKELETVQGTLKVLDILDLDEFDRFLTQAKELDSSCKSTELKVIALQELINFLERCTNGLGLFPPNLDNINQDGVRALETLVPELENSRKALISLDLNLNALIYSERALEFLKDPIFLGEKDQWLDSIWQIGLELDVRRNSMTTIQTIISGLEGFDLDFSRLDERILSKNNQAKDLANQLNVCPTCGQTISDILRDKMVGELGLGE